MAVAQLIVELPERMTAGSLRELLEMHGVTVRACLANDAARPACRAAAAEVRLTPAERAVLRAFSYSDSREEIAARLRVAPATVKSHIESLYRKLRVRSRGFAVGRALRLGLITPQDLIPPPNGDGKAVV